jgi:hypothetical protein
MESNLHDLISSLESEVRFIKAELQLCIENMEYSEAELYKNALDYSEQLLQKLKLIENPEYNKIQGLDHQIKYYKKLLKDVTESSFRKERYEKQQLELQAELTELYNKEAENNYSEILLLGIKKLYAKDINKISFSLNENCSISITIEDCYLIMKLFPIGRNSLDDHLTDESKNILHNLGFIQTDNNWIKTINSFNLELLPDLMVILSRLCYDVFYLFGNKKVDIHID